MAQLAVLVAAKRVHLAILQEEHRVVHPTGHLHSRAAPRKQELRWSKQRQLGGLPLVVTAYRIF